MNRDSRRLFNLSNMLSVQRPGRYTGGEQNTYRVGKESDFHFCLAFPDLYEIGISYYGFQVLYHILNQLEGVSCQRTFLPWSDMQHMMRRFKTPLYTLESRIPLLRFDAIGITLQTELHYPGVVKLLDLAGITRQADKRSKTEPVVIGGGPCAFHPEPVAPFFDAFLLGDGETAITEMVSLMRSDLFKRSDRIEKWHMLATVDGVYVPGLYEPDAADPVRLVNREGLPEKISARVEPCLRNDFYPVKPIVPLISGTQNRLTVEIMRGCVQGCRFCQAGMLHRPVRERSVQDIVNQVVESLQATGWKEVGLLSLSTSDYSHLDELLGELSLKLSDKHVSIAYPSLRPASFTESAASVDTGGRKSSLTFAVEAGSQRLRDVINKSLREDELLDAVERAFRYGWKGIKLYFMVGLPTETDQDIEEGVQLLNKVVKAVPKGRKLHVSVAPFIPKPHSVFEGEQFLENSTLLKRQHNLIRRLSRRWIKTAWRDPDESCVEAVLARGDRSFSSVIETIAEKGTGFEGWGSEFSRELWFQSFNQLMPDWKGLLEPIPEENSRPWGHLTKGITRSFIRNDRATALQGKKIGGCSIDNCYWCGLQVLCKKVEDDQTGTAPPSKDSFINSGEIQEAEKESGSIFRYRLTFSKLGKMRYLGHLDLIAVIERSLKKSGAVMVYTRGYNPRPKMSFSPALPLGQGGIRLWVEFEVYRKMEKGDLYNQLRFMLPSGIKPWSLEEMTNKTTPDVVHAQPRYRLRFDGKVDLKLMDAVELEKSYMIDPASGIMETETVYLTISKPMKQIPKITQAAELIARTGIAPGKRIPQLLSVTRIDG